MKQSPWKGGHGDVVREFADAMRQEGLDVDLYFSCGDFSRGCYSTPDPVGQRRLVGDGERYFELVRRQLRELLTQYGELVQVWFDGAYDPFGWDVKDAAGHPLGTGHGDAVAALVRELQPGAVIQSGTQGDERWSGSEQGWASYPLWNVVAPGDGPRVWSPPHCQGWVLVEANIHTRCNWFWMPDSDDTLASLDELVDVYYRSIGRGANLLVNMTPDRSGRLSEAEARVLAGFGDEIRRRFTTPLAQTASEGRWSEGHTLCLDFKRASRVNHVMLEEDIACGQRIRAYRLEARWQGDWQVLANGLSVGRKRIERFSDTEADGLRIRVLDSDPMPRLRSFAAYCC